MGQTSELISILSAPSHRFTTQLLVMLPVLKNQLTIVQLLPSRMLPPTISLLHQLSPPRKQTTDPLLPLIVLPLPTTVPLYRAIVLQLLSIAPPYRTTDQLLPLIVQPLKPIVLLYRATDLLLRPTVPLYRATARLSKTSNLKYRPTDLASAL